LILVDSSVWVDHLRGISTPQSEWLGRLLGHEPLLIGDLILAEVLRGITRDMEFHRTRERLSSLQCIPIGGEQIALQAARNCRFLRARGITVRGTIDALIATRCIEDDLQLLHSDRDFEPFSAHLGLQTAA
jgi:predicted nucleic acid-binding protein